MRYALEVPYSPISLCGWRGSCGVRMKHLDPIGVQLVESAAGSSISKLGDPGRADADRTTKCVNLRCHLNWL